MAESLSPLVTGVDAGRWRSVRRGALRRGRRTLTDSLYLLTAPVSAASGLLLVLAALCLGAVGALTPNGSRVRTGAAELARWPGDAERWRIARVLSRTGATRRPQPERTAAAADPGRWLDMGHAVLVLPVVVVTSVVTALWWFVAVAAVSCPLRSPYPAPGSLRPMNLSVGGSRSHIALSLGLTSPDSRIAFAVVLGLLMLATLPLVTRACVTVQTGLGNALLSDLSALHRRISGLEQERDTARAQTLAAVTAEAAALRRLERDIHDGPQQRLVRLAMELGRAQHHLDSRPDTAREALADALVQAQETLEELRALSRGIAPPILADRGLRAALSALAARCVVPVDLDLGPLDRRPEPAVETAAYFLVAEALTNVAKHSHARQCLIGLRHDEGILRVWVTDDGVGGAALAKGHGLRGLDDRLHAVGGRLLTVSPDGGPTTITGELPCL
ncbi:sensor domain-containing protein [Streptomyces sp. NPDC090083]|uniref:sensor histidine kinase n=1 Tax=Streptomyces sp. NPDC090083 TaxID=3365941 RepID=UPI00382F0B14